MRIERPGSHADRDPRRRDELDDAIAGRPIKGRVCGELCTLTCATCGGTACQCMCSAHCPEAPRALSSDPDHHPIEPAVLPLVFAMKRQGTFQPCWSCEGHLGLDGTLWKIPRIWFYARSLVAVRLLTDGLGDLHQAGALHTKWRIAVTFSDPNNPETTFSLEPLQPFDDAVNLPGLQRDLSRIADALPALITRQARNLRRETNGIARHAR